MEKLDFNKKQKYYFIGIGGISMSAIAVILKNNGFQVAGTDVTESNEVKKLRSLGITVNIGHKKENITDDIDFVVYSKAIHSGNLEYDEAVAKNIKLISRSEIFGAIMANYEKRICIAGTHGKTTTTAIISKVILDMGLDPTVNVGGDVPAIGGNVHIGKDKNIFIAESCEYTNSFLDFYPNSIIITNIEAEHLDFFKDINDIRNSFKKFIELLPKKSKLFINEHIDNLSELTKDADVQVITYGDTKNADYYFDNIKYDDDHNQSFDVYHKNNLLGNIRLRLVGDHNAMNFIGACAFLHDFGVDFEMIKNSLVDFIGAKRRLEVRKVKDDITYIDDYAHHPSEIRASIKALKKLKYNKMYVIYQPHTFSRTLIFKNDFADALSESENLILAKIYPAREVDKNEISSDDIRKVIIENKNNKLNICEYFDNFDDIVAYVKNVVKPQDIVVTMGAGDICSIIDRL